MVECRNDYKLHRQSLNSEGATLLQTEARQTQEKLDAFEEGVRGLHALASNPASREVSQLRKCLADATPALNPLF